MIHSKSVVVGAGPAGIACAYELAQSSEAPCVFERESEPGGLCRTLDFNGYLFDIGGHRFLTQSPEVRELWEKVMGSEMLHVQRISRIYFHKKFFNYPLSFLNTFLNLGPLESLHSVFSYLWCRTFKAGDDRTFEGWVINRFGKRLYDIFFKTYTEKVWAMACRDISADWAAQRIRGLSLRVALKNAFFHSSGKPKTLAHEFFYPRTGPGEFFRRFAKMTEDLGGKFCYGRRVCAVRHESGRVQEIVTEEFGTGRRETIKTDHLFSTMPLPELIGMLEPKPSFEILEAARHLQFRCFLVVNVILNRPQLFPDQWIYIHDPDVRMGRIQNYKNWSPAMTPDPKRTSLGLEYFCDLCDELWNRNDIDLIDLALGELEKIGIASRKDLVSGFVVRSANAYPVYTLSYQQELAKVRTFVETFDNLTTFGRQGLFRYDNSDHAILSGFLAARNYLGKGKHSLWDIPAEGYLES